MARDLLFEIGLEEVPAKFLPVAIEQLNSLAVNKFQTERIAFAKVETYATPRRLALIIRGVSEEQADLTSENKGPSLKIAFDVDNNPTKAAQGFARGQGIDVTDLVIKEGYVYAIVQKSGRRVQELLAGILIDIVNSLNFPQNMRWGNLDMRFVRPIRWLVALFGEELIAFSLADIATGKVTQGHRFMGEKDICVNSANDYLQKMVKNHCMLDQKLLKQTIRKQVEDIAVEQGAAASIDEELLEEVTYLVEYPTAVCGHFEEQYLKLPPEVIITLMREHQRYFPVFNKDGKLLPVFITVRNGGSEYIDIVKHGNERVLRARLSDAQFFYNEDKKTPLNKRVEKLKTIVFQEGLGTIYDKTIRLGELVESLSEVLAITDNQVLKRSAYLSKADLTTGMVCEFAELQGVMGRQYALIDGEAPEVATAIFEHYLPCNANDKLPETTGGKLLSIADKIDNIVATFSRGLIPTGSQDPYALRRQALGIANILLASKYHLSLTVVIEKAMELLNIKEDAKRKYMANEIREFIRLRLKNILAEEGLRYDLIDAVLTEGSDDIYDAWLRAKAIQTDTGKEAVNHALQAFTRAQNLAKSAEVILIDPALLVNEAEQRLFGMYNQAKENISTLIKDKCYAEAYKCMAELSEPIDAFFNEVMVMVDDVAVRNNRLALLKAITGLTTGVVDLSKIISQ